MLGFRLNTPGPFWYEDLLFFVLDEGRRLPARASKAAAQIRRIAETAWTSVSARFDSELAGRVRDWTAKARPADETAPALRIEQADLLDEPLTWALATEPLVAADTGTHAAVGFHKSAGEQLDALTYVIDQMRDELRPLMSYASFEQGRVQTLDDIRLETSIEALLELSRKNAATRPKNRALNAA